MNFELNNIQILMTNIEKYIALLPNEWYIICEGTFIRW